MSTAGAPLVDAWRRRKSAAFELTGNSTGGKTVAVDFWGQEIAVYSNANFSVYSAQTCNARCPFCVEELRPASRGVALAVQKGVESDDGKYFASLEACLNRLSELGPTVAVTGGEPSRDPRLPRILRTIAAARGRRRTVTTNGSGLLDEREGRPLIDWITDTGVAHLNISRAHPDQERNGRIMLLPDQLPLQGLGRVVASARAKGTRPRLSCVLLSDGVSDVEGILEYLSFARELGIDNVIFRQLMRTDPLTHERNFVVRYSDRKRVLLEPLLDRLSADARFEFRKQIVGYYYYVEVWRWRGVDVVFEEADLAQLERTKVAMPGVVHELVFHPNARLASTWQPWDGVLGPPTA
jgi:GTP 3',8-cyclase